MLTLTAAEQQGLSFEAFANRQGCPYLPTEDGNFVVFENGASVQVRDPLRGMTIVANPSEPPLDDTDETSLRRRLHYFKLKEEREVTAWVRAKSNALTQLRMRGKTIVNGISAAIPRPDARIVEQLKAGKDRCDALRAKIVVLEALIEKLPSVVEAAQREADSQRLKAAEIATDQAMYREISQIGITLPESLRNSLAKQNLSL